VRPETLREDDGVVRLPCRLDLRARPVAATFVPADQSLRLLRRVQTQARKAARHCFALGTCQQAATEASASETRVDRKLAHVSGDTTLVLRGSQRHRTDDRSGPTQDIDLVAADAAAPVRRCRHRRAEVETSCKMCGG